MILTSDDLYLFNEGRHFRLDERLGVHLHDDAAECAVWAPNAREVSVIGDFNGWEGGHDRLEPQESSGIWAGGAPGLVRGGGYKYRITGPHGYVVDKADPFAFATETPPKTASVAWDLDYEWHDDEWLQTRRGRIALDAPVSIYELHLGSWRRDHDAPLSYRATAPQLIEHVRRLGFTHVELLPVMEHPFYGSWGYQTTGFFAPTRRYGDPQDFMYLVDELHRHDIGVILDWVPSHFPTDQHGLGFFDGTHLFEEADPRRGFQPDWNTFVFDYSRPEVRSFLLSSARFWLERYHADGLRVDAVASMLYLDYSRPEGGWIANEHGGRENLGAVHFLRDLNRDVYRECPDVQTIAEESTAWPGVSRPTDGGGLGFGYKWDMGWMHDTLQYFAYEPIHRRYHHHDLTFRSIYRTTENFVLPLSHDEVVHGKGSLLAKMPGDDWQRFANLRLLLGSMYGQPGKKLLFMGAELAPWSEWNHDHGLDWGLEHSPMHAGVGRWIADLNASYRAEPPLHELDGEEAGFEWLVGGDELNSTFAYLRRSKSGDAALVIGNATPVVRTNQRYGVPTGGYWAEILNSDAQVYGGSGLGNLGGVHASPLPMHGRRSSLTLTLPPLALIVLRPQSPASWTS